MTKDGSPQDGGIVYATTKQRFVVTALYGLSNAMNAFLWICFAQISDIAQARFNTSTLAISALSLVFMGMYLPGSFLGVYLMERYGLRVCVLTGAVLNVACAWIRYGAIFIPDPHTSYAIVMVGQVVGALSQPIFTNLPSRIAGDWFPASERDLATVVAAMSNPVGNALGALVPGLMVAGPHDIPNMLLMQAIICSAVVVLSYGFVKDRPPSPPSSSAARKWALLQEAEEADAEHATPSETLAEVGALSTATGVPLLAPGAAQARAHAHLAGKAAAVHALKHMMADFRQLLTNVNYLKLLFGFSVGVGLFNALLTILSQVLRPCGYGDDVASIGGGVLLGCGLASAVALGLLLEKTRAYVPLLKVGITLAVGACAFFLASLHPGNNAQIIASLALLGICLLPLLPLSLENAAECTYPIPEDNSAALMLFLGQMWGIMFIFVFNHLLENWPVSMHCTSIVTPFAGMMLFSLAAASAVMLLFGKDYRRQSAETSKSANIQHDAMGAALGTHVVLA